jgi:hypothetical protein
LLNKRTRSVDVNFSSISTVKLVETVWIKLGFHAQRHSQVNPGIMTRLYKQLAVGRILQSAGVYIVGLMLCLSRIGWDKY